MKKRLYLLAVVALVFALLLAACGRNGEDQEDQQDDPPQQEETTNDTTTDEPDTPEPQAEELSSELFNQVYDSSELPDWAGTPLSLRVWNGHGTGDAVRHRSASDVLSPEIERIFGITLDADNSFDNAGQDLHARLAILAATRDFPELGFNVVTDDLIAGDVIYDLTDLIPIYAPNYYAFMRANAPRNWTSGFGGTGRHYSILVNVGNNADAIRQIHPYVDVERYSHIGRPTDTLGNLSNLFVRDDILQLMFPEARTMAELEELYVQQGYFTREQVFDVPVTSQEEFIQFFYDMRDVINEHGIVAANGMPVYPMAVFQGGDNWATFAWLNNLMSGKASFNYFTFFNRQTNSLEVGFKQPWFKEEMRVFNNFVRDGVSPPSSLIENNEMFTNRLNNGEYAVSFAWMEPDHAIIEASGVDWRFRPVFIDIPQRTDFILPYGNEVHGWDGISIFKDQVSEDDVRRILMWIDFLYTDAGARLVSWGPATAGIWEHVGGQRRFTVPELEQNLVFNVENNAHIDFNLATTRYGAHVPLNFPTMPVGIQGGGLQAPRYIYDILTGERSPGGARGAFRTGVFDPHVTTRDTVVTSANIWAFTDHIDGFQSFWTVRGTGFEPMMTRVLAAQDDAEFEAAYYAMIEFAELHGLTDEAISEAEAWWRANFPDCVRAYEAGY